LGGKRKSNLAPTDRYRPRYLTVAPNKQHPLRRQQPIAIKFNFSALAQFIKTIAAWTAKAVGQSNVICQGSVRATRHALLALANDKNPTGIDCTIDAGRIFIAFIFTKSSAKPTVCE
jgi:hypothetical protein